MPKAVVLVSGGLDSATTLALARRDGFEAYALSFDYGQRHRHEIEAARRVAAALGAAAHVVATIDLRAWGGSALTADLPVPKRADREASPSEIPITYVPARNTIFLAYALAWCEALGAEDIFIGVNAVDYSGYPDCRPEFVEAFERMARLATRDGITGRARYRVHAPLIALRKAEIIRTGHEAGVDFSLTESCYDPPGDGLACGECDACVLRRDGFAAAGLADPTRYAAAPAV
jgi:7-cyano-7-deazaguanine synthase